MSHPRSNSDPKHVTGCVVDEYGEYHTIKCEYYVGDNPWQVIEDQARNSGIELTNVIWAQFPEGE